MQAMADHTDADVDTAIDILDTCIHTARQAATSTR
jgi:glycine C-acetyltransferase